MEDFDPYRIWLGIPPHEQPPNFYRLLGLTLFETDRDVIGNAADRQMAHLRKFQGGKNSAISQKILNELAAARICLMDPNKRAAYDARLRAESGSHDIPTPPPIVEPSGIAEESATGEFPPIIKFPGARAIPPTMPYRHSHHRKKKRWQGTMVTVIVSGVGLLFAGWCIYIAVGNKPPAKNAKKVAIKQTNITPEKTSPKPAEKNPPPKNTPPKDDPPKAVKPPANNAATNEKIGKQLCFLKGNWGEGLPKLADSANEKLKNLAQKELAAPEGVPDRLAVADGWWAVSEKYAPPASEQIRRHAVEWYQKIVSDLEDADRDRAEWRISQETPTPRGEKPPVNPEKLE
jgi:hypothetical protein